MKGRHDLRGGYFLNFLYLDHWQPETGNPRGRFDFTAEHHGTARRPDRELLQPVRGVPARAGRAGANKSVQNELMTAREWQHALYFRDRWTPTAKLTLDLGLRWEFYPIMHRADGRGSIGSISTTRTSDASSTCSSPDAAATRRPTGWRPSLNNFAPRVGGVYRINDNDGLPHAATA